MYMYMFMYVYTRVLGVLNMNVYIHVFHMLYVCVFFFRKCVVCIFCSSWYVYRG